MSMKTHRHRHRHTTSNIRWKVRPTPYIIKKKKLHHIFFFLYFNHLYWNKKSQTNDERTHCSSRNIVFFVFVLSYASSQWNSYAIVWMQIVNRKQLKWNCGNSHCKFNGKGVSLVRLLWIFQSEHLICKLIPSLVFFYPFWLKLKFVISTNTDRMHLMFKFDIRSDDKHWYKANGMQRSCSGLINDLNDTNMPNA